MDNPKYIAQFKLLKEDQLSRFRAFLQSPYHNTQDKMVLLFDKLYEGIDDKTILFRAVFPGEVYNDLKIRRLLSQFGKLVEQFLAIEELLQDETRIAEAALQTYLNSDDERLFRNSINAAQRKLEDTTIRDAEHYYKQYKISALNHTFNNKTQNREASDHLQDSLEQLDTYYIITRLQQVCEQVNRSNILNESYDKDELKKFLGFVNDHKTTKVPAVQLYLAILKTLTEANDTSHYYYLKVLLALHATNFKPQEIRDLYGFAQNYCIKRINQGQTDFLQELFELFEALLENGAILDNGQLSAYDYKNIVFVGLRLGKFERVLEIIEQYRPLLPPNLQRHAYIYNLAYYHFFRKEYDQTLELLNTVRFRDVYYYLDSRSLLLKTFYELEEIDPLYSLSDSTMAYLRRNKLISNYQKQIYQNLFRYVKRLISVAGKSKKEKEALLQRLNKETSVADKTWLKSKLVELMR